MGKVVVPFEHTRDDIRVAEIKPVPGRGAQHKDITHLLVAFPPQWDLKPQIVILGDVVVTEPKRQSPQQRHDLLAGKAPERIDVVNGNDAHWHAELAGGKVVAEQAY